MHARILSGLAWWELHHGDLVRAGELTARAEEVAVGLQQPAMLHEVLGLKGAVISTARGDLDELPQASSKAPSRIATDIGDLPGQALAWGNLGIVHHLMGDKGRGFEDSRRRTGLLRPGAAAQRATRSQDPGGDDRLEHGAGPHPAGRRSGAPATLSRETLILHRRCGARSGTLFQVLLEADRRLTGGDPGLSG